MSHAGRRYIVVGGTGGMGRATAVELARTGGRVAVIGRDAGRAAAVAAQIGTDAVGEGGEGASLGPAVERAIARLGGLDGVAITAGPIHARGQFLDLAEESWAEAFDTQVMTVVRAAHPALSAMIAGGGGSLVTCAAMSIRIQKGVLPHYAAMKSAIASLTKNLALTYGKDGIRANCIAPGAVASEALDEAKATGLRDFGGDPMVALWRTMQRDWGVKSALDRIGEPSEVAELIAFLLSPQARYLTGATINIDGGSDF